MCEVNVVSMYSWIFLRSSRAVSQSWMRMEEARRPHSEDWRRGWFVDYYKGKGISNMRYSRCVYRTNTQNTRDGNDLANQMSSYKIWKVNFSRNRRNGSIRVVVHVTSN